jgi:hypothetical protein
MPLHESIIYYQKLTKKFLMSLPEGMFMETNGVEYKIPEEPPFTPVFREFVALLKNRLAQWENIKKLYRNNRMVAVYKDLDGHNKWQRETKCGGMTGPYEPE